MKSESGKAPEINKSRRQHRDSLVNIEKKSGEIHIVKMDGGRKQRLKVFVKVFANEYEHHIQIYTDSAYKLPFGCLSLVHSRAEVQNNEPTIIQLQLLSLPTRGTANTKMLLETKEATDVASWIKALTPSAELNVIETSSIFAPSTTNTPVIKAINKSLSQIYSIEETDADTTSEDANGNIQHGQHIRVL